MSVVDMDEVVKVSDDPDKTERSKISKILENETNLDRRIDLTEARFLEELDSLERLKTTGEKKERVAIKLAELLLELERRSLLPKQLLESKVGLEATGR